ncbi:MAG: N-acetylmuramoyl-L-alanine amidase family 2 [Verrucomicrobiales bacterium]|nr:N-acetylmuramoyl-L-alanine amidase family 2 [Verrucomicrobiales bacterium]
MKTTTSAVARFYGANKVLKLLLLISILCGVLRVNASTDYAPAVWRSAYSGHWYTTGYGHRFMVEHDMEGYYASTISYFQRSSTMVSMTYCVNGKKDTSSDYAAGEITQMVREAYYSWGARCWNQYCHGTEHEGFVSNPAWFTDAMYNTSSLATRHVCDKYSLAKDRNHIIGHDQKRISAWRTWMSGQGYSDAFINCNDHTDPGAYWDWTRYVDLVKGTVSTPSAPSSLTATAASTTQINLKWADNSGIETGFKIERAPAAAGTFVQIATVGANVLTYPNTGLSAATTYYYRVRAYNATGNSGYSNTANATTADVPPAAPTALTATAASSSQVNLAWTQNSANETGFKVERSGDNVTFAQIATTAVNVVTYSNTGLAGNTTYYYRVRAYNLAGNSAYSNTASDITAPQAPTALTASAVSSSEIDIAWTDNSSSEVGFKIERSPDNVTFTQIATNAAAATTFASTGLAANTLYYFRVRSYNANGNSTYSNVASATTPAAPPVLSAIGTKQVTAGQPLAFTAASTDPNHSVTTTTWQTFESFAHNSANESVMFNKPANSATTSAFIDTALTNYTMVVTTGPTGNGSAKVMKVGWTFRTGTTNEWVRLNTFNVPNIPNPTIDGAQALSFKLYSTKALKVGVGVRETGTAVAYGANGGSTGTIDWAGVTNVVSGAPLPNHAITASNWTTLTFNIPFESQKGFTGDGAVAAVKGVLEHVALSAAGGSGAYTVYLDDFAVIAQNTLTYSLDAGAPAGAAIHPKTGAFTWTPTAGQVGTWNITVRVTDQLGGQDFEIVKVSVISTGNSAPVLAAIGNKTVSEGALLTFTAPATDPDVGQTRTYSLDAGAPSGAAIDGASGAFTWTPTEAQGPGSFPLTVRVTDNGSPNSNDFETITVTVLEVNVAPVLATISTQTINELSTLSVTASATDSDLPANGKTYSLEAGAPAGMTINAASGAISWTTTEADGPDTYPVTVRVTDNGSPALFARQSFNVVVNEVNIAPVLNVNTTVTTITNIATFETLSDGTYNGTVLFHQPSYSSTTSGFLDTTTANTTSVEGTFPAGNISSRVLWANFSFKTNVTNPWLRLSTFNASTLPNPTINLNQRVRFDVYTDKALKIALGVRETATGANYGENGGTTGSLEFVGSSGALGTGPNPTHTVAAGVWTTLEFNLPSEATSAFTGNGVLATGKGVLEHLALVPAGGMGVYNAYFDNFQVVSVTTNLVVDTGTSLSFTASATDADLPGQNLTFSLGTNAPAGSEIDPATGVFSWTPDSIQGPSTNVITVTVTDDGPGNLSDSKNVTIVVNKVNTPPRLGGFPDQAVEIASGEVVLLQGEAEDDDLPANTLTFSLQGTPPVGATIDPSTGLFTWPSSGGYSTNIITIRVTDNGVPPLYDEKDITIIISATNAPPVLTLGSATVTETVVDYQTFSSGTSSGIVMFRQPTFAPGMSGFLNTTPNLTSVTNTYPAGHTSTRVMFATFNFKTGTTNPWVRLTTSDAQFVPNPTIDLGQTVRFDIWSDKALKVGLGLRETGGTAEIGANGGVSGNIEFVGVTNVVGGAPFPNRQLVASNWTTLTFNLPAEACRSMTGNGVLASGKGVLEHLALVPAGGTGTYKVYMDNFQVVTTASLSSPVTVKAGSTINFTATGVNPDAYVGELLGFTIDADAPTNAVMDEATGAFSWTPDATFAGTTNLITVTVQDAPTNGSSPKADSKDITVVVIADSVGALSVDGGDIVSSDETATLTWNAIVGKTYQVQYKESSEGTAWVSLNAPITATQATESVAVSNATKERVYRIIEVDTASSNE